MTNKELIESGLFQIVNEGDDPDREIEKPYCCDLMSIAMSKAPSGCVWVTVMGNINTLAVATLADAACIVLAEGTRLDDAAKARAEMNGICVLATDQPVFETALQIYQKIHA